MQAGRRGGSLFWCRLWFGSCAGFWFERWDRKRFVGEHANDEDGVASADFVAVGESGFFNASSIEEGAIATVEIDEAAAFFTVLDGKMEAGHELVVGKGVIGFVSAADAKRTPQLEQQPGTFQAAGLDCESSLHVLGARDSLMKLIGQVKETSLGLLQPSFTTYGLSVKRQIIIGSKVIEFGLFEAMP